MRSMTRWSGAGKRGRRAVRPAVEALEGRSTPTVALVADLNPLDGGNPAQLTPVGDTLFFTASDEGHGRELWKTDGTPEGTVLVKDLTPGRADTTFGELVDFN